MTSIVCSDLVDFADSLPTGEPDRQCPGPRGLGRGAGAGNASPLTIHEIRPIFNVLTDILCSDLVFFAWGSYTEVLDML